MTAQEHWNLLYFMMPETSLEMRKAEAEGGRDGIRKLADRCLEALDTGSYGPDGLGRWTIRADWLGMWHYKERDYRGASRLWSSALERVERQDAAPGPVPPDGRTSDNEFRTLLRLNCLGCARFRAGERSLAAGLFRRVSEIRSRGSAPGAARGAVGEVSLFAENNLGCALAATGDPEGAAEIFRRLGKTWARKGETCRLYAAAAKANLAAALALAEECKDLDGPDGEPGRKLSPAWPSGPEFTSGAIGAADGERVKKATFATSADLTETLARLEKDREAAIELSTCLHRAQTFLNDGNYKGALSIAERVLPEIKSRLGEGRPLAYRATRTLASALQGLGRLGEALGLYAEAADGLEKAYGPGHPETSIALHSLATLTYFTGDFRAALKISARMHPLVSRALGGGTTLALAFASVRARSLIGLRRSGEAERVLARALKTADRAGAEEDGGLRAALLSLMEEELASVRSSPDALFISPGNFPGGQLAHVLSEAVHHGNKGNWAKARDSYRQALSVAKKAGIPECPYGLDALNGLGRSLLNTGDPQGGKDALARELAARERTVGPHDCKTLASADILGIALRVNRDSAGAIAMHRRALDGYTRKLGPGSLEAIAAMDRLGEAFFAAGDIQAAAKTHAEALERAEESMNGGKFEALSAAENLGLDLEAMMDFDGARLMFELAAAGFDKLGGPGRCRAACSRSSLSRVLAAMGDPAGATGGDAMASLKRGALLFQEKKFAASAKEFGLSLAAAEGTEGDSGAIVMRALRGLGMALAATGNHAKAAEYLGRALPLYERSQGPEADASTAVAVELAATMAEIGDYESARRLYDATLPRLKNSLGPEEPNTLAVMNNLAVCAAKTGDLLRARALLEASLEIHKRAFGPVHPLTVQCRGSLHTIVRAMAAPNGAADIQLSFGRPGRPPGSRPAPKLNKSKKAKAAKNPKKKANGSKGPGGPGRPGGER
ncbi:MAG: tetratricopeptide repeat protein [Deltaproteobacteria bacterium]|nr:tetratricopeptide repeat protein [Deltaproteobacteria bacterium]